MGIPKRRAFMKKLVLAVTLVAAALTFVLVSSALADDDDRGGTFKAKLNGYEEVVGGPGASTGSVSSIADGSFEAKFEDGKIKYRLRYRNMEGGTVSQAHIHFAQRHVSGGVSAFLCGGAPPASDKGACTTPNGDITGEIDASDVIGPADQGIEPLAIMELVRAMRAGATYANVHSTPRFPEGEIRGQIRGGKERGRDRDKDRD
jgi:CHRD domain